MMRILGTEEVSKDEVLKKTETSKTVIPKIKKKRHLAFLEYIMGKQS